MMHLFIGFNYYRIGYDQNDCKKSKLSFIEKW